VVLLGKSFFWREVDRDRAPTLAKHLEEDADKGNIHGPLH